MGAQFSKGDAVDVAFSGTVEANVSKGYIGVRLDDGLIHWVKEIHVEKCEPEYEVFGPGDVVKDPDNRSYWAITQTGYVRIGGSGYLHQESGSKFTSESYERVDLS